MREQPFLPRRRSSRLPAFDYSQAASYFLTICVQDNRPLFGRVFNGEMALDAFGKIADSCWREIPNHFAGIKLGRHVIMPNHMHGIIVLHGRVRSVATDALSNTRAFGTLEAKSIPAVVRSYKSAVTKLVRKTTGNAHLRLWQRNYYEHVIRDEDDFRATSEYIRLNPARWKFDENFVII
jgi:putative transposase